MWLKFSFLVSLGALLWPHLQVTAQLEVFGMLNMSLTANNPNVDYTKPDVMSSNLAALATLMDNVTKTYASSLDMVDAWWFYRPRNNDVQSYFKMGLAHWVTVLNPVAEQIVTLTNDTRYGVQTPPPDMTMFELIYFVFMIWKFTFEPVIYAPGTSATSPDIFGAELNTTAHLMNETFSKLDDFNYVYIENTGSFTLFYAIRAFAWTVESFNLILNQILNIIETKKYLVDPWTVLSTLEKLSSGFQLIGNYLPGNTSLTPPDPIQTYTCGAVFTENLDRFFALLNKTTVAGSNVINSNSTAVTISSNVTQAVGEFNSILPYLTNLTQQVTGMLLNETIMMSGRSRRRVYPLQVRTNLDRADCHKLYLKRYNARRLG